MRRHRVSWVWLAAAALAGSADPLQAQEAEGFAPTTSVQVQLNGILGGLRYSGSAIDAADNTAVGSPLLNGLSLNHDLRLTIDTSVTGQDLFRIRFRSGNFGPSGFFSNPPTPLTRLDVAFQEPACGSNAGACPGRLISVNRAYLQLPLTPEIRVTVGARVMQLDMLPVWPSLYNTSPILDLFQFAGSPGAYSKRLGGGFGAWWQPRGTLQGLSLGYAYVAGRAEGAAQGGGLFSPDASQTSTVQLSLTRPQWNITGAYTLSGPQVRLRGTPLASQLAAGAQEGSLGSWSVAGYWQPRRSGWIPSISAGWGQDRFRFASYPVAGVGGIRTSSWTTGLVWNDLLGQGNSLGVALGSPAHVTAIATPSQQPVDDRGLAWELYYRIIVSDQLTLTPALFWLPRPRGALTASSDPASVLGSTAPAGNASLGVWGGVVRATLRF